VLVQADRPAVWGRHLTTLNISSPLFQAICTTVEDQKQSFVRHRTPARWCSLWHQQ